jgi:hypothetical protein
MDKTSHETVDAIFDLYQGEAICICEKPGLGFWAGAASVAVICVTLHRAFVASAAGMTDTAEKTFPTAVDVEPIVGSRRTLIAIKA